MSKKLKPLTIFLSDDELINFKSHFDEFLNMNCDDKIKEQQQEIERLNKECDTYMKIATKKDKEIERLNNIIDKAVEYIEYMQNISKNKNIYVSVYDLVKLLKGEDKE